MEELQHDKNIGHAMQIAKRAAQIADKSSVIIYTDFITEIGPIVCNLHDIGIEAVGYLERWMKHIRNLDQLITLIPIL